ncbi:ABC transporter permease [Bacteroidota bacterium]
MLKLYIRLGIRHLIKNRIFSVINIIGLSIGMAASIYALIFVNHETNFDNFHPNQDQLYRTSLLLKSSERQISSGLCNAPIAPEINSEIAGVASNCRVSGGEAVKLIVNNELVTIENLRYADRNFFDFLGFKLISGNITEVLKDPGNMVLTQSEAKRIFGDKNPIGEVVQTSTNKVYTVTGIAENPPSNTHINFDALVSFKSLETYGIYLGWDGGRTFLSYLKLEKNIDPDQIIEQFPDFLEEKINKKYRSVGWEMSLDLQKISDVHLTSSLDNDCESNRDKKYLMLIFSIAVIILLLAVINYINIASALTSSRVKEIGIRKIIGAVKTRIINQVVTESLVLSFFAGLLAIIFVKTFYTDLNLFTGTSFDLKDYTGLTIIITSIIFLITGIASGLSPAIILSNQNIISGLNEKIMGIKKQFVRNILVVFQFIIAIFLIVSFFVVNKQANFVINKDLGFDKENLVHLSSETEFTHQEAIRVREEIMKLPEVVNVSMTSQMLGRGLTANGYAFEDLEGIQIIRIMYTDEKFLDVFGLKINRGREFWDDYQSDQNSLIVNQALVDFAGWDDPIGKTISRNSINYKIVGVVNNFHFESLVKEIQPLILSMNIANEWSYSHLNIKYNTKDIQALIRKLKDLWEIHMPDRLFEFQYMDDYLSANYKDLRQSQKLVSIFCLLALIIASFGLFGMSAFVARSRGKEIGVRKVNGANISDVVIMLNINMVKWIIIAFVIACPISIFAMTRWLENYAFKTTLSWWIFVFSGLIAILIALITVSWEAYRAARKNPVDTFKYQ